MKIHLALLFAIGWLTNGLAQPNLQLETFASGFVRPVDIAHSGDERLFIAEQFSAAIWILNADGIRLPQPFLTLPAVSSGNEQGLLGLTFHPQYSDNGYFYINYTLPNGTSRVSRFQVDANDPNKADPNSELVMLEVAQPFTNHNGGCLKFGPDGYLYIGFGDGGSGGDPQNNAQQTNTLLGKLLRIDVDGDLPYAIPPDNPFAGLPNYRPEIWALGLRNPWRFSFDRHTGNLWIGDVGQNNWEEIDFHPAWSSGGENYGWRCYEGNHVFNTGGCAAMSQYIFPVAEYANAGADCSVTGGVVYRGLTYPKLFGHYLYADFCSGKFWSIVPDTVGGWSNTLLADLFNFQFASFGENKNGELFATALGSGIIYRITEATAAWTFSSQTTAPSCPGVADGIIQIAFNAAAPLMDYTWSDGQSGSTRTNLPPGNYEVTITAPNGATVVESFALPPSAIQLSAAITPATCPGTADGAIDLTISGNAEPATAGWSDGSSEFDRTGLPVGQYSVTITTDEGCTFSETFTIGAANETPAAPAIALSADSLLFVPDVYASYQWMLDGAIIPGANAPELVAQQSGAYTVVVSNAAGCTATTDAVMVLLTQLAPGPVALSEVVLSPNPFGSQLWLQLNSGEPTLLWLTLQSTEGKVVFEKQLLVPQGKSVHPLPTEHLPPGAYLLHLRLEAAEWNRWVIKSDER